MRKIYFLGFHLNTKPITHKLQQVRYSKNVKITTRENNFLLILFEYTTCTLSCVQKVLFFQKRKIYYFVSQHLNYYDLTTTVEPVYNGHF